jgi:hypothetical protein
MEAKNKKQLSLMEALELTTVSLEDGGSYDIGVDDGCIVIKPTGGSGDPIWLSDEALSLLSTVKGIMTTKYGSVKDFEKQQAISDDELGENPESDSIVNMLQSGIL